MECLPKHQTVKSKVNLHKSTHTKVCEFFVLLVEELGIVLLPLLCIVQLQHQRPPSNNSWKKNHEVIQERKNKYNKKIHYASFPSKLLTDIGEI